MSENDKTNEDNVDQPEIKVVDKRKLDENGELRQEAKTEDKPEEKPEEKPQSCGTQTLPGIDYSTFVFSLATQALCHLGEVSHPEKKCIEIDLALARQTIDIIGLLQDKTKGNLNENEELLTRNLLTDLRLKFVEISKREAAHKQQPEEKKDN